MITLRLRVAFAGCVYRLRLKVAGCRVAVAGCVYRLQGCGCRLNDGFELLGLNN